MASSSLCKKLPEGSTHVPGNGNHTTQRKNGDFPGGWCVLWHSFTHIRRLWTNPKKTRLAVWPQDCCGRYGKGVLFLWGLRIDCPNLKYSFWICLVTFDRGNLLEICVLHFSRPRNAFFSWNFPWWSVHDWWSMSWFWSLKTSMAFSFRPMSSLVDFSSGLKLPWAKVG